MTEQLQKLQAPFPADQLSWRVSRSGTTDAGEPWIRVVPYLQARTIQERLDDVLGPGGWQVKYRDGVAGHLICALGVKVSDGMQDGWLWKEDGTGQMEARENFSPADAGKGDFSNAFKRAAAAHGIGRYVGYIAEDWARITSDGRYRAKVKHVGYVEWDPPELPAWALPGGTGRPENPGGVNRGTGELEGEPSVEALEEQVRSKRNEALRQGLLTDHQATKVDEALESGAEEKLRSTRDWLDDKLGPGGAS